MLRMHFIAGLPRSGSTLLRSLFRQNPEIETAVGSPVHIAFQHARNAVSLAGNALAGRFADEQKRVILRAPFEAFYNTRPIGIDTNRLWTSDIATLVELYPDCRVICCVRDLGEVVDSYERVYRDNPLDFSRTFGHPSGTVYERVAFLSAPKGVVGGAYNSLREAFYNGEFANRIVLIDYKALCLFPAVTMSALYQFLDLAPFPHVFDNLEDLPETGAVDTKAGLLGLHKLRKVVSYQPVDPIIPPDLFNSFGTPFWYTDNLHNVPVFAPYGADQTGEGI